MEEITYVYTHTVYIENFCPVKLYKCRKIEKKTQHIIYETWLVCWCTCWGTGPDSCSAHYDAWWAWGEQNSKHCQMWHQMGLPATQLDMSWVKTNLSRQFQFRNWGWKCEECPMFRAILSAMNSDLFNFFNVNRLKTENSHSSLQCSNCHDWQVNETLLGEIEFFHSIVHFNTQKVRGSNPYLGHLDSAVNCPKIVILIVVRQGC